jgi:hypothetical protein
MAIPKLDDAINDFSAGELDPDLKRSGSQLIKLGGRQMRNWRTLNSHKKANRPGRSALFRAIGRTEKIIMPGGAAFFLNFSAGALTIYNPDGTTAGTVTTFSVSGGGATYAVPWSAASLGGIVWAQIGRSIYIAYPDGAPQNVPQILSWDGVATWSITPFTESLANSGQKRTPFYRISAQGTTLLPSATTGAINLTFSAAVLAAGQVGTRMRFCGRQLTITGVSDATHATAITNEPLPPGQTLNYGTLHGAINVGDIVIGGTTGAEGIVTSNAFEQQLMFASGAGYQNVASVGQTITQAATGSTGLVIGSNYYFDGSTFRTWLTVSTSAGAFTTGGAVVGPLGSFTPTTASTLSTASINVQLIPVGAAGSDVIQFSGTENVAGPSGNFALTTNSIIVPQAVSDWDEEVMNLFRGYPASVFADQSRLGFCNFRAGSVPSGLAWSAVGLYSDFYPGAQPDDAIFELAPNDSSVLYVIPGMESSEFVFTDKAIYYIPISGIQQIPLKPGSVSFNKLSDFGILPGVQPRRADQSILYVKAGGVTVGAVQAPGAYYRPYVIDDISELHSHLFTASPPIAIAIPSGPTQFEELYIYIALKNGNLVSGRYIMRNGLIEPGPEGKPTIGWLPWTGAGTLTWISANQGDVFFTGAYTVNAITTISILEKLDNTQYLDGALFVNNLPPAATPPLGKGPLFFFPGPNTTVFLIDNGTRFMDTYSVDGNGFIIPQFIGGENLASPNLVAGQPWTAVFEPFMPHAPPGADNQQQRTRRRKVAKGFVSVENSTGFVFGTRRVPAYFMGDDATQPAPLREDSYKIRPLGRSYDPRLSLIKDTPGPLTVVEYCFEVTV